MEQTAKWTGVLPVAGDGPIRNEETLCDSVSPVPWASSRAPVSLALDMENVVLREGQAPTVQRGSSADKPYHGLTAILPPQWCSR